jgi:predicted ATPase
MALIVGASFRNLPPGLALPDGHMNVFTGPNNSGKSAILQWLNTASPFANQSDYVSPRRFDVSNQVSIALNMDEELRNLFQQRKQFNPQLAEFNAPDAIRELLGLEDVDRSRVVQWHNEYFGELRVERASSTNEFSAPKITIDGRLVTEQGSGSRAVLAVLVALINPRYQTVLIDEPEIGIEPQVQRRLAALMQAVSIGDGGLAQKTVYVATHSHLILDRETVGNNYVVTKDPEGMATVQQVETDDGLAAVTFNLLGNSPSDLFYPDNVLVVEGPSDQIFLRRVIDLAGGAGLAVYFADGDGNISSALPAVEQMLKTQALLPRWYRERICVLVDSSVSATRIAEWRSFLGDDGTRVRQLSMNGIEHFYPASVLAAISGLDPTAVADALESFLTAIRTGSRASTLGSFVGSKRQLAAAVGQRMDAALVANLSTEILGVIDVLRAGRLSAETRSFVIPKPSDDAH